MALHLGHRARIALRYFGIFVFGVVCFVFALQLTFPYSRVKQKAIDALSDKYDVTIQDVKRGVLPGVFYLESVTLTTRPTKPDDSPTTFFIKELEVNVHLMSSLMKWGPVVSFDAKLPPGHISGTILASKSEFKLAIDGDGVPSALLPMREVIGLPMSGKVEFDVDFDIPIEANKAGKTGPDWSKAEGEVNFSCPTGCTIGDGHTKLKTKIKNARNAAFAADGIDFGKVEIQSLIAQLEFKNGKSEVTKFETKSDDGELHVEFSAKLEPNLDDSTVTGCLRYKGSPALEKKEGKTFSAIQLIGGPLGPDTLYHIKLQGQFRDIKRLPQVCGPGAPADANTPSEVPPPARPNLVVHPDEPVKPPPTITPPPPPQPPINPPPPPAAAGSAAGSAGSGSALGTPANGTVPPPPPPEGSAAPGSGSEQPAVLQ